MSRPTLRLGLSALTFSLLTSFALADSYPGPFNYRVPIGGSWKLKAGLVSTPSFVSFSEIGVGLSSLATVTLTNADTTEQPLTVGTLTAPFSLVSTTCSTSLAPGSSCAINLAFTPTAAGNASSSLPLSWGTPASAMALLLTGSAATPSGPVPLGRPGVWEAAIGNYAGSSGKFLGIDSQGRSILNQVGESPCLEISVYPHAGADITSPVTCVDLTATGSSSQVALWGDTVIAFDNANASYIKVSLATQVHTALPNLDPNGANANRRFGTTLLRGRSDTSWLYSPATDQMVDSSAWDAVLAPVLNEQIPVFTPMAYDDATQTVVGYYAVSGGVQVFRARLGEAATSVFVPIEPDWLAYLPDPVILPGTDGQLVLISTENSGIAKVQALTGEFLIDNPNLDGGAWGQAYALFSGTGQPFGYQRWNSPDRGTGPFVLRRLP